MKTIRFIVVVVFAMSAVASAQWLKYPTAGIPRTADGKPDLTAPTPRHANGKPVLAGLWRPAPGTRRRKHREEPEERRFLSSRGPKRCSRSARRTTAATIRPPNASSAACRDPIWLGIPIGSSRCPAWWLSSTRPCTRIARFLPTGASCRRIRIRHGSATRSGNGTATPSS